MSGTPTERRNHDIAYACFIPPGIVHLIAGVSHFIPMDSGTAGGIGFLILIPLTIAAIVAVPIGIFYVVSFSLWRDPVLMSVSIVANEVPRRPMWHNGCFTDQSNRRHSSRREDALP